MTRQDLSPEAQRIFDLIPAIYRIRDAEEGGPLAGLIAIIAEQYAILDENLSQLYDDQFVETAAPWVLPYIADLIGLRGLQGAGAISRAPRAEVADTIAYRRRKGTAAALEALARDVTGWPARVVEYFQLLATTQYVKATRLRNQSFLSLRRASRLEFVGGPFETAEIFPCDEDAPPSTQPVEPDLTHNGEVRRIPPRRGRYNIPNIGLFLWRIKANSLTRSPAAQAFDADRRRWLFDPLGGPRALFNQPRTETDFSQLAERRDIPAPLTRRLLKDSLDDYYGDSIQLELADPLEPTWDPDPVTSSELAVCDLSDWSRTPAAAIGIDPVLGRIAFPADVSKIPLVSFYYGFPADIGGGEYDRSSSFGRESATALVESVRQTGTDRFGSIHDALDSLGPGGGIVEVLDSGRYAEKLSLNAGARHITLRAADKRRPTVLLDGDFEIQGDDGGDVTLDGFLFSEAAIVVRGALSFIRLRNCTLVPGKKLKPDGDPDQPGAPALVVESKNTVVEVDRSITGPIRYAFESNARITASILDAGDSTGTAVAAPDGTPAGVLRMENCTVFGGVLVRAADLVSNSIFTGAFVAQRKQEGCVRFSYLPPGSRAPRPFHCLPGQDPGFPPIIPVFVSTRYGQPGYGQLSTRTACAIRTGADDESEMGAFHDLYEPQRLAHLRSRVDEFLRFGLEAGVFLAS